MTLAVSCNGFQDLSITEMQLVDGGIEWGKVALSAGIGAGIGATTMGYAGAGCGTVVLPVVGTATVGAVCAVGGAIGGAILGATKSILTQIFN